jgi:hypothetical protein
LVDIIKPATQAASSASSPAAYQRLLPRVMATQEVRVMNVDVLSVVLMVMGKLPRLQTLREAMRTTCTDFNEADFDELDDVNQALLHAHGLYLKATKSPAPLQSLVQRAEPLRDVMYADAITQVKRGNIPLDALREVKRTTGHRILLTDLQILHAVYRETLPALQGKTTVTFEELDEVVLLIDTLAHALGLREHTEVEQAEATVIRAKAFALLVALWDEVRAAVLYVRRHHGDADDYAPSAYSNRTAAKRPAEEAPSETGVHAVVPADTATSAATSPTADLNAALAQNGPFKRTNEG